MEGNSHNGAPDDALVQRSQGGDATAFGDLYLRYHDRVFRLCLRRLNDRHEAEDAAQETFTRAWKALPQFSGERHFYPWLKVIAQNICTDVARRRSRIRPTEDLGLTAAKSIDISEDVILAGEEEKIASLALKRLSPRHQQVLAMRDAGLTYQQIAEHEDVGVGTVETLLWRARQALKRQFALLSEGRKAVAWFLVACAAVVRRLTNRLRSRSHSTSLGGFHGAVASGVTTAGVAVTFVALPMWSTGTDDSSAHRQPEPVPAAAPAPRSIRTMVETSATPTTQPKSTTTKPTAPPVTSTNTAATGPAAAASPAGVPESTSTPESTSVPESTPAPAIGAPTTAALNEAGNAVSGTTNAVGNVVSGVSGAVAQIGSGASQAVSGATGLVTQTVNGVVGGATQTVSGVVGGVVTAVTPTPTTTTTSTVPGLLNGVSQTVNGLLGK